MKRSPAEVVFRLRQEIGNLWLLLRQPSPALDQPAPLAGLPDPEAVARSLRGTAYASEIEKLAEQILAHEFPILGFEIRTGPEIRWRRDYVSGVESGTGFFRFIPYLDAARAGDHKVVWELNRHQHLVVLAQAFLLTGRGEFLAEIRAQLESWFVANPFQRGINWASALEVAFRALSWIWVYHLAGGHMEPGIRGKLLTGLYRHGRHLQLNLSVYFSPNTHLMGEAVALHALGALFPSFPGASRWRAEGARFVRETMDRQVRGDGTHFEQSTYYHLYSTDFFLFHALIEETTEAYRRKLERMAEYLYALLGPEGEMPLIGDDDGGRLFHPYGPRNRFGRASLAACAFFFKREDGLRLTEGEPRLTEDGPHPIEDRPRHAEDEPHLAEDRQRHTEDEPHRAEDRPCPTEDQPRHPEDRSHHSEDRPHPAEDEPYHAGDRQRHAEDQPHRTEDRQRHADDGPRHPEAWPCPADALAQQAAWWFGPSALQPSRGRVASESRLFPDLGIAVMASGGLRIYADAGPFGRGRAGHSHSDTLSLTVSLDSQELLIDPATYTYVGDPAWRNWFRGSAAHNTVRIDGRDQARPSGSPFGWASSPQVEIHSWVTGPSSDYLDASCRYDGRRHRRRFFLIKGEKLPGTGGGQLLFVLDELDGPAGTHTLEQFWHTGEPAAALDRECFRIGDRAVLALGQGSGATLHKGGEYGWRSFAYGHKTEAPVVVARRQCEFPALLAAVLAIGDGVCGPLILRKEAGAAECEWKGKAVRFPREGLPEIRG